MPRSTLPTFGYMLMVLLGACREPAAADESESGEAPVVGKLQFQDRVVDLTLEAFSDDPNKASVPKNARANVMADIIVEPKDKANGNQRFGLDLEGKRLR